MSFTLGESQEFLTKVFGSGKLTGNGINFAVCCPVCQDLTKKKLEIRLDCFVCHCWVCGFKSKTLVKLLKTTDNSHYIREYLDRFAQKSDLLKPQEEQQVSFPEQISSVINKKPKTNNKPEESLVELPKDFKLLVTDKHQDKTLKFLFVDRGLTEKHLWYYKIGTAKQSYPNRVIIPSHNKQGELNYFITRTTQFWVKPKYYSPIEQRLDLIFNEINIDFSIDKTVVLVEGVFDLFKSNYQNTIPLLGSELNENSRLFKMIVNNPETLDVVLGLDNDAKQKTIKLIKQFQQFGINPRVAIPTRNDFGEMTTNKVTEAVESAKQLSFKQLLEWNIK